MLALLFLAGLFIQIPSIPAQEVPSQEESASLEQEPQRDPRAGERDLLFAEGGGVPAAAGGANSGPSVWTMLRMVLTLALAAAAIYGVVYFIKRVSKPAATSSDPFLKVLASAHLGSNRYAHIVGVGDRAWLLGSSDGGVNLIGEIENKDILNAMLVEDSRKSSQATPGKFPDFLTMLRRAGARAESGAPNPEDIRRRRERLKGL